MSIVMMTSLLAAATEEFVTGPVEIVAEGFQFTEGPVWLPSGGLIFSDIPADTIYRGDKTVFRKPSGKSNGLTLDKEGRLIACEHWNRRVTRTEKDGSITVVADAFEGKKLNSPNDVVVRSDGTVFFSDPPYGLAGRQQEQPGAGVYAVAPDGKIARLIDDFEKPNGLAFSPDENTLYVADTEKDGGHIRAFDVAPDGSLSNGRLFCKVPGPDGMKVDERGYVWCAADNGVRVFSPAGESVFTLATPQGPANCAFGDVDGKTLYVTARTGVYKVRCAYRGVFPGGK